MWSGLQYIPEYSYHNYFSFDTNITIGSLFGGQVTGSTLHNFEVPSYKDTKPWVQKADNAVGGISFTYRGIQVFADYEDIYENVENTVYVYYNTPDGELVAYVILNADTTDVLLVEMNP